MSYLTCWRTLGLRAGATLPSIILGYTGTSFGLDRFISQAYILEVVWHGRGIGIRF